MKKRLAVLLVLAMTAGTLSACGNGDSSASANAGNSENSVEKSGESSESRTEEEKENGDNAEIVQVKMWQSGGGEKAFMDEIVETFNSTIGKENNVEIVMENMSENYDQQLSVAFQNGEQPDFVTVRPANIAEYAEKGYLMPLDEIPGIEETVAKSNATQGVGDNAWGGNLYMIPYGARTLGLAYNKDMFVEAGIVDENGEAKPPVTIEEMVEDAKILTNAAEQKFGFCAPVAWGGPFTSYYIAFTSESSTGIISGIYDYKTGEYDFEGMRPMAEGLLQMKEDGSIYPGAEMLDNDAARARFAEGGIGMMMTVQWDCAVWNDQFPAKCDWSVAPLPVKDADNAYVQYGAATYSSAVASKGFEEGRGEAIALVFNYLFGEDMVILRAERGMMIPWNADVVAKCDFSNTPKGWKEFCELSSVSCGINYLIKSVDLDGLDAYGVDFVNNVWSGKQSLDEWISVMNERYREGTARFMENNPDIADIMAERMDANLDLRR